MTMHIQTKCQMNFGTDGWITANPFTGHGERGRLIGSIRMPGIQVFSLRLRDRVRHMLTKHGQTQQTIKPQME